MSQGVVPLPDRGSVSLFGCRSFRCMPCFRYESGAESGGHRRIVRGTGALTGCSGGDKVVTPSATVQRVARTYIDTAPDRATVPKTLATVPATTVVSAAPVATAPIEGGVPVLNLLGVAEAALAAHDELNRQQLLPPDQWDKSKLLEVMTAEYTDFTLNGFAETAAVNRRYEAGTVEDRKIIRIESSPEGLDRAFAIICWKNNSAEYDTRGTQDVGDDLLIQDRLDIVGSVVPMKRENGRWLRDGLNDEEPQACAGDF